MPPSHAPGDGTDIAGRMRRDWDRRAGENAEFYIASGAASSEEAFRASGRGELDGAVLDGILLDSSASALEIGCGVGRLLVPLSERIREVHGVDISEVMIEKSRAFCASRPNIRTNVTDGTLRALPRGTFDFVFSFIVFQHIPDRAPIRTYVEEAARVLKRGGLFRFQVDGRWRSAQAREANTYDGVKFSPGEVRDLLRNTRLEVLEEWGQDTHYHWVTARKRGWWPRAKARFCPREWDLEVLRGMLARCGVEEPEAVAERVIRGKESLRHALDPAGKDLEGLDDAGFVRTLHERVWGFEPAPAFVAQQTDLLERKVEFREDVLDILLLGAEMRDVVRPFVLTGLPWYRVEGLREAGVARPDASPAEVAESAAKILADLPPRKVVEVAFTRILGQRPDATSQEFWTRLVGSRPSGRRVLVRRLLGAPPPRLVPPPPPATRRAALAGRIGMVGSVPGSGESFRGESAMSRRLLEDAKNLSDRDFVRRAYGKILGRAADEGGESYWTAKLEARDLNRPGLLRELFWSDELRNG